MESLGYSIEDFYAEVRDVQNDDMDEGKELFINCLLASMVCLSPVDR